MICRLCLKDVQLCLINIFDEMGVELNVAEVVAKHFWFEPKADDPISNSICEACWHKVTDFNEFYKSVEEAHRLLNERFSFSFNTKTPKKTSSPIKAKDDNAVSTTTVRQNVPESNYLEDMETSSYNDSNLPAATMENQIRIDVEEIECSNNVNDNTIDTTDSNNFVDHDEISTYMTLNETNALDRDALEEARLLPENERSKRITRAASRDKKMAPHLNTSENQFKISSANIAEKLSKRGRGRPKKDPTNTPPTPVKSLRHKAKKIEASSTTESVQEVENENKQSYRNKIHEGNMRIAQFLKLRCDVCNEIQETFALLCKHMSTKHFQRGFVNCCNKKFYKRVALLDHVEKHLNPEMFSCKECDKTFADKQCLRNHLNIKHLPEESKTFACNFCDKKFGRTYLLEQHQRTHKERNHICDFCQKGFPSLNQLKAHIKVIHDNYGATMCEICSKVIRGRAAFTRHMLQHKGVELPKVQCPQCGSWHKDKYSLQKHIRRHNIDGTEHVCNECGKVSPNRSALLSHKRFVHKTERPFKCNLCKKAFKIQISLKEHMATHTGQALYKCPYCSRTFNSNANMHSHRKKMHPKEFAEARMQRKKLNSSLTKKNVNSELAKDEENEAEQSMEHHPDLSMDSRSNIDLDNGDNEETHILMINDKFGEIIFKVE